MDFDCCNDSFTVAGLSVYNYLCSTRNETVLPNKIHFIHLNSENSNETTQNRKCL